MTTSCVLGVTVTRPASDGMHVPCCARWRFCWICQTWRPAPGMPIAMLSCPRRALTAYGSTKRPYDSPIGFRPLTNPYVAAASAPGHGGDEVATRVPMTRPVSATTIVGSPSIMATSVTTQRSSNVSFAVAGSERFRVPRRLGAAEIEADATRELQLGLLLRRQLHGERVLAHVVDRDDRAVGERAVRHIHLDPVRAAKHAALAVDAAADAAVGVLLLEARDVERRLDAGGCRDAHAQVDR